MLIILGLDALVLLLASRNPESAFLQEAARQMTHARWEGLHLYDLVFPVFVFISGVSMSFSLGKYTSGNASSVPGLLHLWKRALVLAFLGLLVNGTLTCPHAFNDGVEAVQHPGGAEKEKACPCHCCAEVHGREPAFLQKFPCQPSSQTQDGSGNDAAAGLPGQKLPHADDRRASACPPMS